MFSKYHSSKINHNNESKVILQFSHFLIRNVSNYEIITYNFLARYAVAASSLSPPLASICRKNKMLSSKHQFETGSEVICCS